MKKIIALLLALTLLFALAACGKPAEVEDSKPAEETPAAAEAPAAASDSDMEPLPASGSSMTAVGNPMTEYNTLDEINELLGCRLHLPPVMGVSDVSYATISSSEHTIGQAKFSVNGTEYNYRFSADFMADICGIYDNGKTLFDGMEPGDDLQYAETADTKSVRWFTTDGQYCLSVSDDGSMDKDLFLTVAEELQSLSIFDRTESDFTAYYENLAGFYTDSFSQRATAEVVANGSKGVTITVHWSSSAFEYDRWVMDAYVSEDGTLSYPFESHATYETDENGESKATQDVVSENGGWFDVVDGALLWSGACDESCRECVFVKDGTN